MDEIKFELIWSLISSYSLKILGSITILLIGKWLVAKISNLVSKLVISSRLDETLSNFLLNIIKTLLMAFVLIAAIANLGVETSMFVAALGAIGLAIGMAFKDTFSNIGAGFLIIFFRPFKLKDHIEVAGVQGAVKEINMFSTVLRTTDHKTIIIPNGRIISSNIINFSKEGTRRVELVFCIDYKDDKILKEPKPFVGVGSLGENSVNLTARFWCASDDFSDVQFAMLESVKLAFDAEGISIPSPQLSIRYQDKRQDEQI